MRNEPPLDSARDEPDPLDALIDSAARQMVAGEPSVSLRSAVRDRIEHGRSQWLPAPAIAGAAAAIVIAVVLVGRTSFDPAGTPGERDSLRPPIQQPTIAAVPGPQPQVVEPETARSVRLEVDQRRPARRLADDVAAPPQEEEPLIPP